MNDIAIINEEELYSKLYNIRGKQVMLDADLAKIYGYTTKDFNRQVKNNIEKFDADFRFQLTKKEFEIVRCNFFTSNFDDTSENLKLQNAISNWGGTRYLPYAFTEQGVYMLMTVLKGELAVKQSKALIRIFKRMKDFIITNNNLLPHKELLDISIQTNDNTKAINKLNNKLNKTNKELLSLKNDMNNIMTNYINNNNFKEIVILNNHVYEADLAYINIFNKAKKSIYIIDDYIDIKTLSLLSNINKDINIIIFSDNVTNHLVKEVYFDFLKEYNLNITIIKTNNIIHDRYIILDYNTDDEIIYTTGSFIKDAGSKITSIVKLDDNKIFHSIIDNLFDNESLFAKA